MDRLLNYIFLLILVYILALWGPPGIYGTILIGTAASLILCFAALIFRWLTLDGAGAATVVGIVTFGLGGWPVISALLFFFISSTLISGTETKPANPRVRRDGRQVWSNGFWIVCWLLTGLVTNFMVCWVAACAAIATATADTWATELGSQRFDSKTYLTAGFREVSPGTEGGISVPGLVASLVGSAFIAAIAWYGFSFSTFWFIGILAVGLAGSLLDSYLGARWQGTVYSIRVPGNNQFKKVVIDNNMVNWLATGVGSFLILILNLVFYEVV